MDRICSSCQYTKCQNLLWQRRYIIFAAYKSSMGFFCVSTSRSPSMWNPTGPDPGPESRPFEIGNPVHSVRCMYTRTRARATRVVSSHREISRRGRRHIVAREGRSSNPRNSRILIQKTGRHPTAQGYVSNHPWSLYFRVSKNSIVYLRKSQLL